MKSRGLWPYLTGKIDIKSEADSLKDEEAKTLIYTSMDSAQINQTGRCTTSRELWLKVKENNEGAEKDLRKNALHEFLGLKIGKN